MANETFTATQATVLATDNDAGGPDGVIDPGDVVTTTVTITNNSTTPTPVDAQLVFIDCQVPDRPGLIAGLKAGTRVYLLDAERDALKQIADVLAQQGAVEAVHIVTHGSPGELHFASGTVSRASLTRATAVLERIGAALAPAGDLLLWACDTGRGRKGEIFLDALAVATGVNVVAATHPVGSLAHGGSWDLDAAVGPAATRAPFTVAAQTHYAGLLQAPPVLANVAGTASYTENAAATVLSNALTVSDPDNANLVSATVRISGGFLFGDVLAADVTGTSITASYDPANGTMTLTGSDTLAHYQQVLRTVALSSTSDNPTDFGLYQSRTIDWQVNDGTVPLQTHVDYPAGITNPQSVAIGDLNGDGNLDLAVANFNDTVSVLLGTGTGTFGAATSFAVEKNPRSVAVGDLNGDGNLDLAVANIIPSFVSVLLGTGSGGFGAVTNFAAGSEPWSVAIGDLNGDGNLDLAVANQSSSSSSVSVLLGNGSGGFDAVTNFAAGTTSRSVAIGDLNDDGNLDLAVANYSSSDVSVLLGTGTGTFGAATNFAAGAGPSSVAIGDLNGDGDLDLAVANLISNDVSVLLGAGSGGFGAATNFAAGVQPIYVAIGDLDGSSGLDLAVANAASPNVSVLRNDGTNMSTLQHTAVAVTATNDPPVLGGAGNTVAYTEQAAPILVDSVLSVADVDSLNLTGATVTISAADFQAGDTLHFTDQNGITGSYDANTGMLTVTGAASPADYQAALRSVTFDNLTNDNPTNFGATPSRIITWVANDGAANSTGATSTINVTAVSDAPVITSDGGGTTATISVAENTTGVTTVTATDPDGPSLGFSIVGGADQALFQINAATGPLSFITAPNFELPTDADGNNVYDVTVQVSDGNGGVDTQAVAVTVTNANDAPINTVPGPQTVAEDATLPIAGVAVADADGDALTTFLVVLNGTLNVTAGTGVITGNGTNIVEIGGTAAEINAALAGLAYTGNLNFNGDDTLTVITRDGNAGGVDEVAIAVTPVNDAPVAVDDGPLSTAEDTPLNNIAVLLNDTDVDLDTLSVFGTPTALNGTVTVNADGTLNYTPAADYKGPDTITYTVTDGSATDTGQVAITVTPVTAQVPHDFDGDSGSDILWQDDNGTAAMWLMDGTSATFVGAVGSNPGPTWEIKKTGDFNGDGKADIIWQGDDGTASMWLMDGHVATFVGAVGTNPGPSWEIKGTGDFNGDGKSDIIWQGDDGTASMWLMDGSTNPTFVGAVGTNPGPSWEIKGTGDFNGDGKSDIIWQGDDGTASMWLMDGSTNPTFVGAVGTNPGPSWEIKGTGDFNGDGKSDIIWQGDDGTASMWLMDGSTNPTFVGAVGPFNPGPGWEIKGTGDFNGDGKSDIMWQGQDGTAAVWLMNGTTATVVGAVGPFNPGATWDMIA